jgi:formyl-CoA transferase
MTCGAIANQFTDYEYARNKRMLMLPLEGITVIAVEQAVAAPFCSSRLADAGAHVIKVERPEGDFARSYDAAAKGQSSYFVWLNRGKDSVVIDLATKEGRDELEKLIAGADVLLQNLKPGSMDKLGFPLERLRKDYPGLICCTISGYGDDGPYAHRKAYDLLIQAESGLASITGGPEGASRVGMSIVDVATGATAHAAILEALIGRSRTGKGADIRISMFDVMADWLTVPLLNAEAGAPPKRMGLAHPSIAPYGVFRSSDGREILISIQSEREWKKFCADVLGQPELPNDPRFANMVERVKNRALTDKTVGDSFVTMTRDALLQRLAEADIAFAEVNTMAELAIHPHLRRIEVETPAGLVRYPAPAPIIVGEERHYGAVPAIGEGKDCLETPRARAKSS